ncbi:threonine/serine dehydratase [Liquorilactobacillus mali]|uniref:threonine ammonia-lyase n=1 Tax=Liquorilactobacillus mali TaxID=1618 RepID=UPI00265252DB|nr:threonine/serine dehydratase [Liquorilactobacillus mali]MDN7144815.1 threonine/serine dehydratase [Liquorilactobacillus mali]
MSKADVTLQDIMDAAKRINTYIVHTPLLREEKMDQTLGGQIYLKPEMLQITGAFKIRGALNKILSLPLEKLKKGIITSSSGNHAQACAYAGQLLNIKTTVVIPEDAPAIKIENARAMGANVITWNRKYDERWKKVKIEANKHKYSIIHAYEDYTVMAGQGTIGLEIYKDLPNIETVLVPIGGGGLISGVSTALKALNPKIRVIGVQAAASCAYYVSRQNGIPSSTESSPTIADGLTCNKTGKNPYPIIEKNVDDIVIVAEEDIEQALRLIAQDSKLIAEPSACVTIAALLSHKVKIRPNEKICAILTSGNWDIDKVGKILNNEHVEGVM